MDVFNFINNLGESSIRNPEYNPKSKRNAVPSTYNGISLEGNNDSPGVQMAIIDFSNQHSIASKDIEKYRSYGINWNPWEDVDKQLADAQSNWTKFGNALAQTLVSEIGIGTFKGASDLIDFIGSKIFRIGDGDYSNPVSQFLEEKQEEFRNYAPIYRDESLNIANGGLLDAGWWTSNMPSIASSLTLLIPSTFAVKGLSALGKLTHAGKFTRSAIRGMSGINKTAKNFLNKPSTIVKGNTFLENGLTAAMSRTMENYQEARQTYNDMYVQAADHLKNLKDEDYQRIADTNADLIQEKGLDRNDRDGLAKAIAEKSADATFKTDFANIVFDVIEMYGLKNAWKGVIGKADNTAASVRRAHLDQLKYAGKNEAEIAALKAERKFTEKAGEWLGDRLYGSKVSTLGELSEGVEEAVNYIAQEEGMTFGNVLLGKEDGERDYSFWKNVFSGFDGRITDYVKSPELYDAAFWGVLGGVVFQGLGGHFRRIANKITDSKSAANDESQKDMPWYQLAELPENQRRIADIRDRYNDAVSYRDKLAQINKGIDIYNSTEDNEVEFRNPEEQELARQRLADEYIAKMTLRAAHAGNIDMLKAYLEDGNVRKGMVELGLFSDEAEATAFMDRAVAKMSEVENMYNQELIAIDNTAAQINRKSDWGGYVPAEYMQIVATKNVFNMLAIQNHQSELADIDTRIAQLKSQFESSGDLDANIDHEHNIRLGVFAYNLGVLRAQRKELLKEDRNSLTNRIAIEEIDKRIAAIESKIENSADLVFVTAQSLRYAKNDKGEIEAKSTPEYRQYLDEMITKRAEKNPGTVYELLGLKDSNISEAARTALDEAGEGKFKVLRQDASVTYGQLNSKNIAINNDDDINKSSQIAELDRLYKTKASWELSMDFYKRDIARTTDKVEKAIGNLHNTINAARKEAINQANANIIDLYLKNKDDVKAYINSVFDNTKFDENNTTLSSAELQRLKDSVNVLALTKSYNRSLYSVLEQMLDIADEATIGQNVENTTNENQSSDTETSEQVNNTQEEEKSNTEPKSNEIQPNIEQNNQPTTENSNTNEEVTPVDNTTASISVTPEGNITINNKTNNDATDVEIIDNNDGTYSINPRDNKTILTDSNLFNTNVDLLGDYTITSLPIIEELPNGEFKVVKRGEIVNNNLNQQKTQQVQSEEQVEEQTQQNSEQVAEQPATIPSTGEVVETPTTEPTKLKETTGEEVIHQNTNEDTVFNNSLDVFARNIKANPEVNLDKIADNLIKENINNGVDRATATKAVNRAKAAWERVLRKRKDNSAPTMQSSVDEVIISQAMTNEVVDNPVQAYNNAVNQMLNQYAKEMGIKPVEGITYINLEDLLRYINQITNDNTTAGLIYGSLVNYIKKNATNDKFAIEDEEEISRQDFLTNVNKTAEERYQEITQEETEERVDIKSLLGRLSEEEKQSFYEALDALQPGDKLTTRINGRRIEILDNQGRLVGELPIPGINSKTGAFEMINDGWVTDIIKDNNGNIISNLRDLFVSWFNPTTEAQTELYNTILEFSYGKPSAERKQELLNKFKNNEEVKSAISRDFTNSSPNYEQLINGLVKLMKYTRSLERLSEGSRERKLRRSLDKWFSDRANTYQTILDMRDNLDYEVSVGKINEGQLIQLTTNGDELKRIALPAKEALAGGINPDIQKIGIIDANNNEVMTISGMPFVEAPGFGDNNFYVILPNRSGRPTFINATYSKISDKHISEEAKEIANAVKSRIADLIVNFGTAIDKRQAYQELVDFLDSAFSPAKGNTNLFYTDGIKVQTSNTEIKIIATGTPNYITIYRTNKFGGNATFFTVNGRLINLNDKNGFENVLNTILDKATFNVRPTYINSDNNPNLVLRGLATRENGKFVIRVGDKSWEYNSYNEFILNNNLVRLNTKPNKDGRSNFNRVSDGTQLANQVFRVKITRKTSSPVKETSENISTNTSNIPKGYNKANFKDEGTIKNSEELNNVLVSKNGYNIFQMDSAGRTFVLANINEVIIPFYMSSKGTDGKIAGNWYPFFGMTGTWLVKGDIAEDGSMSYSPEIDRVTKLLNDNLKLSHTTHIKKLAENNKSLSPFTFKDRFPDINDGKETISFQGFEKAANGKRLDAIFVEELTGIDASSVVNGKAPNDNFISGFDFINNLLNKIANNRQQQVENISKNKTITKPSNTPINEQVRNIIESNSENKGEEIVKAIIGTNSAFTEQSLNSFNALGLLPKIIKFDENFNTSSDNNAKINIRTGEVTIGQKWFDLFNNPSTRERAIRVLIHEQLHYKLDKNKGYKRSAKEIYDEFEQALNSGVLDGKGFNIEHLKEYLFKDKKDFEESLEEFLVESLTNKELVAALNAIDAKVDKKRGARNLFQKILELMAKVFGWDVRKGSLYEKELHTLRDILDEVKSTQNQVEETQTTQSETNTEQVEQTTITQEINQQQEETISPIDKSEGTSNYGTDESSDYMDMYSSVDEISTNINGENNSIEVPSIQSMQDRLPLTQQVNFASLVSSATISVSCK